MASLSLVFDMLSRDVSASKGFRDVGNAAERAGKQTSAFGTLTSKAMASAGAALAAAGIGALFTGFIQDARESARISRITEAAIRSTGGAANVTARQVGELATALSNKTAIDDEAIQSAENLLLTFTRVRNEAGAGNDIFDRATAAVLDMSVAMGTDANTAAMQLGKALNDPIKGMTTLGRAGVQFTEDQKEQIRTLVEAGDVLSAQKIILEELGTQFGGAAEAAADPLDRLMVVAGNLGEEVGAFLLPAIEGFANFVVDDAIPAIRDIAGVIGDVVGFFGDLPGPIQAAVGAFGAMLLLRGPMTSLFETMALKWLYFKDSLAGTTGVTGKVKGALSGLAGAFSPGTLGVTAAVAALPSLIEGFRSMAGVSVEAERAQEAFADALRETNGVINETSRAAAERALLDVDNLVGTLRDAGVAASDAIDGLLGNADAQDRVNAAIQEYINSSGAVQGGANEQAEAGRIARNAYAELATTLGLTREEAEFFAEQIVGTGEATGVAADATVDAADEAAEAIQRWRDQLANINASFIDPLAIYQGLMQQAAQATADATADATDSWSDYAADAQVSLADFETALRDQITAQENWRTNLVLIAQRGGTEVANILASMGVEGAGYVQQMVDANGEDFATMRDLMIREANLGGDGARDALEHHMAVMAEVGRLGAAATASEISRQLGIGVADVQRIAAQYGVNLASGINPLLVALGKNRISGVNGRVGGITEADGGVLDFFANGSEHHVAQIAKAGSWRVWAEPETGGEAYIPLAAGKRDRSTHIWREVGKRLGVQFQEFADGGFTSIGEVPRPPSTAPYRLPISTAGDAAMEKAYNEAVDWLKANLIPPASAIATGSPGQWQAMFAAVQKAFPSVVLHSGFRPGSITATGNLSYHALGRAIDITPDMGIFNWLAANYPSSRELIFSPAGGRQIWNGRPHVYSEPTRGDHWDHIHWAMANGGVIGEPVYGIGARSGDSYLFGEKGPETVTPGVHGPGGDLTGLEITGRLELGGDGMARIVDGRVAQAFRQRNLRGRYNR